MTYDPAILIEKPFARFSVDHPEILVLNFGTVTRLPHKHIAKVFHGDIDLWCGDAPWWFLDPRGQLIADSKNQLVLSEKMRGAIEGSRPSLQVVTGRSLLLEFENGCRFLMMGDETKPAKTLRTIEVRDRRGPR